MPASSAAQHRNWLHPNDPSRPCWGFFRDVLGDQDIRPQRTTAEARDQLRDLLVRSFRDRPYRLLKKALYSSPTSRGQIERFVRCLRTEGGVSERPARRFDDPEVKTGRRNDEGDPYRREALDYIASHLWEMGDGKPLDPSQVVNREYRAMGTSTKEPIKAWLPEKLGVITYLRARTGHVLQEYYDTLAGRNYHLSLDRLREGYLHFDEEGGVGRVWRMELNEEGRLVQVGRGESRRPPSLDDDLAIETSREQERRELRAATPVPSRNPHRADRRSPAERFEEECKLTRQEHPGDWPLRLFDPIFRVTSYGEGRKVSWQYAAARRLVERLRFYLPDFAPPRHINDPKDEPNLIERMQRWPGIPPFTAAFPEIVEASWKCRHQLRGIERTARRPGKAKFAVARFFDQNVLQASRPDTPAAPATAAAHRAVVTAQIALTDLMSGAGQIPALEATRSDYAFLTQRTRQPLNERLAGAALSEELQRLAGLFCFELRIQRGSGPWMAKLIEQARWDPAKIMFGDLLWNVAGTMSRIQSSSGPARKADRSPEI
ncbi:MAG: hypothetical protein PHE83_16600 [Opitutaceae bacterium]|nr:hypothetical protein [Opitutaceae bacterium]